MKEKCEQKQGWKERQEAEWTELKAKQGKPTPETVAKTQRVLRVGGIIIMIVAIGIWLLHSC